MSTIFHPDKGSWLDQYRHFLFEFSILVACISSLLIGVFHYFNIFQYSSLQHAYNCFIFSTYEAIILTVYLRNKKLLNVLAWIAMIPVQLILFSNLIYSINESVRLLWFVVAYIPSQFLGGAYLGLVMYLSSVAIVAGYYLSTNIFHETDLISSLTILTICYLFIFYLQNLLLKAESEISSYAIELKDMVILDGLTGLYNRRFFDEQLAHEWMRSIRDHNSLSLVMIDIDRFKEFNDSYGHIKGDDCLRNISTTLKSSLARTTDMLFRYGGEEFALILPNTNQEDALLITEKLRKVVETLGIEHKSSAIKDSVTISAGVFTMSPKPDEKQNLLLAGADNNLYLAKSKGRNQVV
jgi:diguanylate cyclase (GGDEF)-like protein